MADIWDDLDNPQVKTGNGSTDVFGQLFLDTWKAVLVKGTGKVPFDAQQHKPEQAVTAIKFSVLPLAEMNLRWDVTHDMIAESKEWAGIVLPSLKALNVSARELNEKFVHARWQGLGSFYNNAAGEQRERRTLVLVEVFADEASCRAAYQAYSTGDTPAPVQQPVNGSAASVEPGRAVAEKFLPVIIDNAVRGQSDLGVIRSTIAANISAQPMISKYFTVDSPEVMSMIAARMTA